MISVYLLIRDNYKLLHCIRADELVKTITSYLVEVKVTNTATQSYQQSCQLIEVINF